MLWEDIAHQLAPIAPTLGRALGNTLPIPFGGTLGEVAGKVIADALGVAPTPEAVSAAVESTPNDVLKAQLGEAEAEAASKFNAMAEASKADGAVGTAQVTAVASSMQAELINGSWAQRTWRPFAMFVWVISWPIQLGFILWNIGSRDPAAIANLASVVSSLALWNAGPAALAGVYSFNRTQEKVAATQAASST